MSWPNLTPILAKLRDIAPPKSTDAKLILKIKPGVDLNYDNLRAEEKEILDELTNFLKKARRQQGTIQKLKK